MSAKKVVISLMGGLGNQMFQYAAGRAVAQRNAAGLVVDATTGFLRDKTFKRQYELDSFSIPIRQASSVELLPLWLERSLYRLATESAEAVVRRRPWGTFLLDYSRTIVPEAFQSFPHTVFLRGYWQSEDYFADIRDQIGIELRPPSARHAAFAEMGRRMEACNSIAVGVRLFEEVPGGDKSGVGGVVEISDYKRAARQLVDTVERPEFFVFCTSRLPALAELDLPGPVHFITHDNGFEGSIERLWLLSRGRYHVISNSSFYWWGAWLAEFERPGTKIIAIDKFPNVATIPARWMKIKPR